MIQIVVLSGKGGTGKTTVAASLVHLCARELAGKRIVIVDADVDASNLELALKPSLVESENFQSGRVAVIDDEVCTGCGSCEEVCRFDAVHVTGGHYVIDRIACEGCAACVYQCPVQCISMTEGPPGKLYRSDSRYGPLHHAALYPGGENSGKLVTVVRNRALNQARQGSHTIVLADGPPGTGCPVIAATSGTDVALVVSEPSVAGLHDLRRIIETVRHFRVTPIVCINKADIYREGTRQIETYCEENDVAVVGTIPYDQTVPAAMLAGEAVVEFRTDSPASRAITSMWARIKSQTPAVQIGGKAK